MNSSRFWISEARASSPAVRLNDQPRARVSPLEKVVALMMARAERATPAHAQSLRRRVSMLVAEQECDDGECRRCPEREHPRY